MSSHALYRYNIDGEFPVAVKGDGEMVDKLARTLDDVLAASS